MNLLKVLSGMVIAAAAALGLVSCEGKCGSQANSSNTPTAHMISVDTPARPDGQKDMLGFAADKLDTVRIGFIGLGMRGPGAVERMSQIEGTQVVALCDLHQDRVDSTQKLLSAAGRPEAVGYAGSEDAWKQLVERDDIDLVYIATNWQTHVEMALYAMEKGKHVAIEVPAAFTMEDIWALINTSERTRKHCMMLENCVYDFFEMTTLNMAHRGLLGEILYAEGGYIHNLSDFWEYYEGDWRMTYNKQNRGDVYPTHGMGPACQILDIHRGDKMNYLVSMDSDPVGVPAYLKAKRGDTSKVENGQHTLTLIRTEKGKTIEIHHDVATSRPYSRQYNVAGSKGFASKYPMENYAFESDGLASIGMPDHEDLNAHSWISDDLRRELMQQYKHPITAELEETAKRVGGHGGMDFIMDYRLIYCLRNGLPLDMDVYDLAEWCCVVPLSKLSIENGSMPVEIPDFTRGGWNKIQGYRHAGMKE